MQTRLLFATLLMAAGIAHAETKPLSNVAAAAAAANRAKVAPGLQVAVLGGGCFWGMQELLRKLDGVVSTEVGYTGGAQATAEYEQVSTGETGHAESVKVVFDPKKLSYENLLVRFFKVHDPTTVNRQENDVGTQYRSVIFYQTPEQGEVAHAVKARLENAHVVAGPVVTQIVPAMTFYRAEEHHQDYLQHNPHGYQCHYERKISF